MWPNSVNCYREVCSQPLLQSELTRHNSPGTKLSWERKIKSHSHGNLSLSFAILYPYSAFTSDFLVTDLSKPKINKNHPCF